MKIEEPAKVWSQIADLNVSLVMEEVTVSLPFHSAFSLRVLDMSWTSSAEFWVGKPEMGWRLSSLRRAFAELESRRGDNHS